jgi:folate-binding protein YgfZ
MGELIDWNKIVSLGADATPSDFGNPQREFAAVRSSAVVTPVTHFSLLRFHGGEAKAFLQGQLTCDLEHVLTEQAQFGGYCTPKGRLVSNFLLLSAPQGYLMYLPADMANAMVQRLRKFVMRAQVTIDREGGIGVLGIAGPHAQGLVTQAFAAPPPGRLAVMRHAPINVIRLPHDNFLVVAPSSEMPDLWDRLTKKAVPAGAECWNWAQIQAGLPWITAATQEQFLPQMIGLDAIGGVSFDKGCYTGQEIVARSRYLGEIKRKVRIGSTLGRVRAGDALFSQAQPCGTVVNSASVPGGGSDFLAVMSAPADAEASVQTASGETVSFAGASPLD